MFFRWLQDEDYMKNFGAMIGSFTGFIIGLLLSIAIGLAVVPTTTTKIEEYNITKYYIDDNKLYYVGEDGTMGRIDIDNGNIKTGNKTYIEKRYYKVNKRMNFVEYYNRNKDEFEKYGAEVNLNIPICKYEEDHQCRFDCPIFGVCGENPC